MAIEPTHWSRDRSSYGYNIPEDLPATTLEEAQPELKAAGLEVARGDTRVIVEQTDAGGICVGSIVRFPNGDLQARTRQTQVCSSDGGQTWDRIDGSLFQFYVCNLRDGETIQFASRSGHGCEPAPPDEPCEREGYVRSFGWLIRSTDNGRTERLELVPIEMPEKLGLSAMHHARIIELADGTLLAFDYGRHSEDPSPVFESWVMKQGIVHAREVAKSRTFVIRSTDRGRSWHYLTTVAFDLNGTNDHTIGGFTEPDAVLLPDGQILCFMRCVAGGGIRPLRMSRSTDNGHTWSMPVPVADRGVMPYICRMDNGILALIYGRPYNWLTFSVDDGHRWFGHFQFYHGPKAWDAWNYCAVDQVAPDTLLAVYGRADPDDREQGELVGTFFHVKRI